MQGHLTISQIKKALVLASLAVCASLAFFGSACSLDTYFDAETGEPQAGVTVEGERISGLKAMRPEVLSDMLYNAFGERYGSGLEDAIVDTNYKLYLGGIDYEGVIDRPEDFSPTNALVIRKLAREYCAELIGDSLIGSTFLGAAGFPESDVNEVIGDLYRMVRSRPISAETLTSARGIYDSLEPASEPEAWQGVCIFLFLAEGGIGMY